MKKTQESGRSMVEMLGVLAIIGVLSIGGIAGYSMAMNRYRANEALDMATKYAVILYAGNQTFKALGNTGSYSPPSLKDAGLTNNTNENETNGGATIENPTISEDSVTLDITFPSEAVCKAASSILGTGTCGTDGKMSSVVFKQS